MFYDYGIALIIGNKKQKELTILVIFIKAAPVFYKKKYMWYSY